jgi:hypothetical protein
MSVRPRKCQICRADFAIAARINAMLESHVHLRVIAAESPEFSVSQLSRHRNRCLAPNVITGELAPDAGGDDLQLWMQRCADSYHVAVANGDSRSAIAACSAATRQLVALAKKQEKEREQEKAADDPDRPLTVADCDRMVADFMAKRDSENGGVAQKSQCLLIEEPAFGQIVQAVWANRHILPALLAQAETTNN